MSWRKDLIYWKRMLTNRKKPKEEREEEKEETQEEKEKETSKTDEGAQYSSKNQNSYPNRRSRMGRHSCTHWSKISG